MKTTLILIFALSLTLLSQGRDPSTYLQKAQELADKALAEKVDPELVAMKMKLPYPIPAPTEDKNEILKDAIRKVEQEIKDTGIDKTEQQLLEELDKEYSLFKIGDIITVTTRVKFGKTVTGRFNNLHNGYAEVGKTMILLTDLDDGTIARFNEEKRQALLKSKLQLAIKKNAIVVESFREKKTLEYSEKELLKHYYLPTDKNVLGPNYISPSNWDTAQKIFKLELDKEGGSISQNIIKKYMNDNNFEYDEDTKEWYDVNNAVATSPKDDTNTKDDTKPTRDNTTTTETDNTQPKPAQKKSFFQKLKEIF